MVNRVIEDVEQFKSYLASQPLCQWAAQKQRDMEAGKLDAGRKTSSKKSDNAELADALASMA